MSKVVFMIDGWFMRKRIYKLKSFQPELSEHVDFIASKTNKQQKGTINEDKCFPESPQ